MSKDKCCYDPGFYCAYYEYRGATLEGNDWVSMKTAKTAAKDLRSIEAAFSVQEQRDRVPEIIRRFSGDAPFEETVRFPLKPAFIMMDCGSYPHILSQISRAAAYKDRTGEKENLAEPGKPKRENNTTVDTNKQWNYDDSLVAFGKGVRELFQYMCQENFHFDRREFENRFGLVWMEGYPHAPVPCKKRKDEVFTAAMLKALIRNQHPHGRDKPKDWRVNLYSPLSNDCTSYSESVSMSMIPDDQILIKRIYVLFSREATIGDQKDRIFRSIANLVTEEVVDIATIDCTVHPISHDIHEEEEDDARSF